MTSRPPRTQIVARRFDGLGGRLNAMVNAMVLADAYDLEFRFAWRDTDETLGRDPGELFDHGFVDCYVIAESVLASRRPRVLGDDAIDLGEVLSSLETDDFLEVDWPIGLHPAVTALGDGAREVFAEAFNAVPLVEAFQPVLEHLAVWDSQTWTGVHVRAGDVVSGAWRRTMWHEKYLPTPLLRFALTEARSDGRRVILVTDDPEFTAWLAGGSADVLTVPDVLGDLTELTPAQRALADLLVLSRCGAIVAPPQSAFSTFASLVGGCPLTPLIEMIPRDVAHDVMAKGLREQSIDTASRTREWHFARDLIWYTDAFSDLEPAPALLDRARSATRLDAGFTAAWARHARLAARCGRFEEAWRAVAVAVATGREDQRQDDSAVDADLALVVVGCLELLVRGWSVSSRARDRRLERIRRTIDACGTRQPHHWHGPALAWANRLVEETRRRLELPRRRQWRSATLLTRRLREPLAPSVNGPPYDAMRSGSFDSSCHTILDLLPTVTDTLLNATTA